MNGTTISTTHLEFTEGTSYKEYNAVITQVGSLYNVYGRYGRIGSNLTEVTKATGVEYKKAMYFYNKLIRSKEKKRYRNIVQDVQSRFTEQYRAELAQRAATLTAEGGLERNHYASLKAMLLSPDDETLTMAENIVIMNEEKLHKNAA
jgi:predicted DNA-binding WGR domain protein